MHFAKHHSKGYWALVISITSFLVIHAVFYFAHEGINAAAPNQEFLYKLDRGLEPIERIPHVFQSEEDVLRTELTHVIERVEELETIALEPNDTNDAMVQRLLGEIAGELQHITSQVTHLAEQNDSVNHYALLLHAQTILEHVHNRVLATQITSTNKMKEWDTALTIVEDLNRQVVAHIESSTVDEEKASAVATGNPGLQPPTASVLEPATASSADNSAEQNSCGQKLSTCTTNTDCCVNAGLTCQTTLDSSGQRNRRCMPVIGQVCEVQCQNDAWSRPKTCTNTIVLPSYKPCDSYENTSCTPVADDSRNLRPCVRS